VATIGEYAPMAWEEMDVNFSVGTLDCLLCLGEAADLVHPQLTDHHKITGFIAASMAQEMQKPLEEQEALLCAGLIHDIGAFSVKERIDVARYDAEEVFPHCLTGYRFLNQFPSLSHIAGLVRHHHVRWERAHVDEIRKGGMLRDAHLLHLADRIAVALIGKKGAPRQIGNQVVEQIGVRCGGIFDPELMDVFRCLSQKEEFWFDMVSMSDEVLSRY